MQALVDSACQVSTSSEARTSTVTCIIHLLKSGQGNVLQIVQALQEYLTSEEDSKRVQGTRLLADVVKHGSQALSPSDVHYLAEFLAARLMDWPCVEQAALGCAALLQDYSALQPMDQAGREVVPKSVIAEGDAMLIVRTAATGMAPQVQALAQAQRSACLHLLQLAIQEWGPPVLRATQAAGSTDFAGGVDLLEAAIAAVDGEKDPRCLLISFRLLRTAVKVYHAPGVSPAPLSAHAEEVVEVLSCYFPVSFIPPKNDPFKITRYDLAQGLEACMAASPFLACWVMPLVLEKLSSTYRPAKEDALSALVTCCCSYGIDALQPHLPTIWTALRNEMVIAPSAFGVVGGEELQAKRALAARAASCLSRIMTCVRPSAAVLQDLATKDACVQDLITLIDASSVSAGTPKGTDPDRPNRLVLCTADLLGTMCGSSVGACQHVLSTFMPCILSMLPTPSKPTPTLDRKPSSPAAQPVSRSRSWSSMKVVYCLAVARGVLKGISDGLQAQRPHTSAATPTDMSMAPGPGDGCGAHPLPSQPQPQPHNQQQQYEELCAAYVAALAPDFVGVLVGATLEAMQGVAPECLGTAMQVDDAGAADSSAHTGAAPQVLLACTALWQELLRLHMMARPGASSAGGLGALRGACLLSQQQLTEGVVALTDWALVAAPGGAGAAAEGGHAQGTEEEWLLEGVVTPVASRVAWKVQQSAHTEALAALLQALPAAEAGGPAAQQHVLERLCAALLGPAPALGAPPSLERLPPAAPVRARALHAAASLSSGNPFLALALYAALSPLMLRLLAHQASCVGLESATGHPAAWVVPAQEVLLLLGQQLPPTLPQPLPTHHAAALSAFVDSLLEAPLDAALLQPAAASAAPAAAVSRALAAACAPCSSLTACVGADEQRGVAMAACEAVARVHAALQGQAHMAARGQSPPSAPLSALPAGGIAQAGGAHAVAAAVGVPDGCLAHACAACSVIAGLHPAVLEGAESVLRLVDALCDLATWHAPHSALLPPPVEASAHQEAGAAGVPPTGLLVRALCDAAAVALASLVNKCPGGPQELEGLACRVLGRWGVPGGAAPGAAPQADHASSPGAHSWHALAWTARALAMRGSPVAPTLVEYVVGRLSALDSVPEAHPQFIASLRGAAEGAMAVDCEGPGHVRGDGGAVGARGEVMRALTAAAGAVFFGILLGSQSGGGDVWHHARPRVLWQQRALVQCLGPVRGALARTPPPPPGAPFAAPASIDGAEGSNAALRVRPRQALLLALASLLGSAPLGMLHPEAPCLVLALLSALHELPDLASACAQQQRQRAALGLPQAQGVLELEGQVHRCVAGALRVLEQLLLRNAQLRALLEEHTEQLVLCLAQLVGYQGWPAVREAALRCCMLAMELPYHLLHPHRLIVIRAVTKALDDDKRSVRTLAVRCRRLWVPK